MEYRANALCSYAARLAIVLISSVLLACGTGGEELNFGGPGGNCDPRPVTGTNDEGVLVSRDGLARIADLSPINPRTFEIRIDCSAIFPGQIGKGYHINLSSPDPSVQLVIDYAGVDRGGVSEDSLKLGRFLEDSQDWLEERFADQNFDTQSFVLSNPLSLRYAIYSPDAADGTGGDNQPPTVPVLTSITKGAGSVTIEWQASTDDQSGISSYLINRLDVGPTIGTTQGAILTFTDTGGGNNSLIVGTTYCYTVAAQDGAFNRSDPSEQRCIVF